MRVRRVVTGHDRDGKAVFASDEQVDPLTLALIPGAEFHRLWGAIDFEVVLSGEVILELDDGVEKVLGPGDTVVQNGTRHRWGNRGTEPAVVVVFLIGAHRASK